MQCAEFEDRLNELLDERQPLTGDARLIAHASTCTVCAGHLRGYEAMCAGLALLQVPATSEQFTARVIRMLHEPAPEPIVVGRVAAQPRTMGGIRWAGWALAASLAAVGLVSWPLLKNQVAQPGDPAAHQVIAQAGANGQSSPITKQHGSTPLADQATQTSLPPAVEPVQPALGTLAAEARGHWLALAGNTRADVSDALRIVPGVNSTQLTSIDVTAVDAASLTGNGWTDDLAEGLRPVTNTTSGALGSLLRALPTQEEKPRL